MSNSESTSRSEQEAIEASAAAWLAQQDDGFTAEQATAFERWLTADSRHGAAIRRLDRTWKSLQALREFRPEASMHPDHDLLRAAAPVGRHATPAFLGLRVVSAAAALAAVILAAWWWFPQGLPGSRAARHYSTTVDGYERVALEDGSLVELNSNTEVRVHYSDTRRHVRLLRGEAHFTVAKNTDRPFSVEAGDLAVYALGTAFNVRLGAREIEVLVTEGTVRVGASDIPPPSSSLAQPAASNQPVAVLVANERTRVPAGGPTAAPPVPEKVEPAVVRETLAWQGLRLMFSDTPLAEVVAQFNRRNVIQLVIADAELESLAVGGSFRAENVEAFVRLLESDNEVVIDRTTVGRIVLRKAK